MEPGPQHRSAMTAGAVAASTVLALLAVLAWVASAQAAVFSEGGLLWVGGNNTQGHGPAISPETATRIWPPCAWVCPRGLGCRNRRSLRSCLATGLAALDPRGSRRGPPWGTCSTNQVRSRTLTATGSRAAVAAAMASPTSTATA